MDVSVIIPTYNRGHSLARAIQSVQDGDVQPLEIIIVDDGSTDDTKDIVHRFPHVRYLYQENRGVSAARNLGIQQAKGTWIALLDSDDIWLPHKLKIQCKQAQSAPILHCEEIWIRNGVRVNQMHKHRKQGGDIFERCLELCCVSPSSVMLKKSLFETHGYFDEALRACEDYDLWLRLCAHHHVSFIETPCIQKYGGHEDQLSRQFKGLDRLRSYAIDKLLCIATLTSKQYEVARAHLIRKLGIFIQGAEKRGRQYPQLQARHQAWQQSSAPEKYSIPQLQQLYGLIS